MPLTIHHHLASDHARLDGLLARASAGSGPVDDEAYGQFRAGLLRHIAMEEKVLFADLRARNEAALTQIMRVLHADHAAIAPVRASKHVDEPRVYEHIERMLAALSLCK